MQVTGFTVLSNRNVTFFISLFLFFSIYSIIILVKVMKEEIVFRSVEELYNRVLPALYSKRKEINSLGFKLVTEKDIWNYLVENEWKTKRNLELHDLINDIFYVDNIKINDYVMRKVEKLKRVEDSTVHDNGVL